MIILIDNGHGADTKGKCSPDERLKEYAYARDIADRVDTELKRRGYESQKIVKELRDIPLLERSRRANEICNREGAHNVLLVSIHCNAAGSDGHWHNAHGWSVFVSRNASHRSKKLAKHFVQAAEESGISVRKYSPDKPYWTQNIAICRDTKCPAVLTENMFQDNRNDVEFLLSEVGRETIARIHVEAILKYIDDYKR